MTFKEKVDALNEEYFDLYRNGDILYTCVNVARNL